jgi:TonB-dependent receptor
MFDLRRSSHKSTTIWLFCILLMLAVPAFAQSDKGILTGTVSDSSGLTLVGAQIKLMPLGMTSVSTQQGLFTLREIPAGNYTMTVTYVGFSTQTSDITIVGGQSLAHNVAMTVASATEQVLVTADRPHGEAEAINETRSAENIMQVIPADVIVSLPNANVADATGRLPSVTLYRIEGEGVYIQVRGTEPRLTNVTVDNITLPAPEPTVRQVRLDVIPSDMVDAIQLNKTLSANQDANGIGGSVNLRTKEAGEAPTINLYGNGGHTNIINGRNNFGYGGTVGKRFGANKRFGILAGAVYDFNGRGIDNIQPALDPLSTFAAPFYDDDTIREYRYYRTRYGFSGSSDYRFNEKTDIYAHGFYSDLKDWGDKWYYAPYSTAITAAGVLPNPSTASPAPKFYTSSKRPNASVGTLIVGGHDARVSGVFAWQVSASRSYEVDSAGNPKADFSWIGPSVYCNYVPSGQNNVYRPHFGTCDTSNTSPLLNPNDWIFKDITISKGINAQLNLTAAASYAKNYNSHGHFGILEAGFKFTNGHQSQDSTETVYDGWSTKATSTTPTISQLQDTFNNTDYFNGSYFGGQYGPVSNFLSAQSYTYANFAGNVDVQKTAADIYPNLFHTVEQITAGYVMNSIDFGKLHLQTGLRLENTRDLTFGYTLTFVGPTPLTGVCGASVKQSCYSFQGINNNPSYLDVLPSIQVRYGLTPNSNLRAVYARGIARPDPYQLVPYVTEDETASPVAVTIGNPALRREHANNYDLLYENYLNPLGLIQAGFFFKQITGAQIATTIPGGLSLSSFPAGYFPVATQAVLAQYPGDAITQTVNGQNAYLYGLELSFQQHLSYLPGPLHGLGITVNYSYTASRLKGLPLRVDHPTMIDQTPNAFNIGPTYDTNRLSVRAGLAYNGASLFTYNYISPTYVTGADPSGLGVKGPSGDVFTLAHYQVDAQASYRFYRGLSAVVSGLNLNNEVFGYYQGSGQFVNQREYYKPTYSGGLRYNFTRKPKA